jgi:hypothetical protein
MLVVPPFFQIIGYLDLRVNELEGQQAEYAMRCQQLQASLDLQFGSHSHKVYVINHPLLVQMLVHGAFSRSLVVASTISFFRLFLSFERD